MEENRGRLGEREIQRQV